MFSFLRRNNKNKLIERWTDKVWALIDENEELKSKIDQEGILNGREIIFELLEYNEYGLAYEHLIYIVQESGIHLVNTELNEISHFSSKIGLDQPNLMLPTIIEIEEFYRILYLFNLTQKKAVEKLIEIWDMKSPMKPKEWIVWSQNRYAKDQFKNDFGIKISPHGFGLSYQDNENYIDFDFGKNGEVSGFDINRIWHFIEVNKIKTLFRHENQIKKVVDNQIGEKKLEFSGYISYYQKNESQI